MCLFHMYITPGWVDLTTTLSDSNILCTVDIDYDMYRTSKDSTCKDTIIHTNVKHQFWVDDLLPWSHSIGRATEGCSKIYNVTGVLINQLIH